MICYKNKVIFKKLIYFIKTIPSEDCMMSSKGRLLEQGMLIHVSIVLSLQGRQTLHYVQYRQ